ncbi:hypothetical protein HRR83_000696 [Exophiala dermatitidis]|uniref:Uncharacterized protein n=1 Tax=Exophiala dermatitidis TaxID=5970 RepID=A0AAN6IZ24_EXODE|nr:hypothetical protein HRR74_000699 [Exophiala dermatitidis]KAJ4528578.1 hypothetical protein HRR73_001201 [Exophiala dermatitidis]KAJ4529950.1 hypothetical protein HRR76_009197 [Exophiala dermatitidis]KAJ4558712.1 hypothetical protein HRR77_000697 [Exophiala dermatitidis]KAJ4581259.1 hypothetical protein HRR79_000302 [Exophiala dermatitidis]
MSIPLAQSQSQRASPVSIQPRPTIQNPPRFLFGLKETPQEEWRTGRKKRRQAKLPATPIPIVPKAVTPPPSPKERARRAAAARAARLRFLEKRVAIPPLPRHPQPSEALIEVAEKVLARQIGSQPPPRPRTKEQRFLEKQACRTVGVPSALPSALKTSSLRRAADRRGQTRRVTFKDDPQIAWERHRRAFSTLLHSPPDTCIWSTVFPETGYYVVVVPPPAAAPASENSLRPILPRGALPRPVVTFVPSAHPPALPDNTVSSEETAVSSSPIEQRQSEAASSVPSPSDPESSTNVCHSCSIAVSGQLFCSAPGWPAVCQNCVLTEYQSLSPTGEYDFPQLDPPTPFSFIEELHRQLDLEDSARDRQATESSPASPSEPEQRSTTATPIPSGYPSPAGNEVESTHRCASPSSPEPSPGSSYTAPGQAPDTEVPGTTSDCQGFATSSLQQQAYPFVGPSLGQETSLTGYSSVIDPRLTGEALSTWSWPQEAWSQPAILRWPAEGHSENFQLHQLPDTWQSQASIFPPQAEPCLFTNSWPGEALQHHQYASFAAQKAPESATREAPSSDNDPEGQPSPAQDLSVVSPASTVNVVPLSDLDFAAHLKLFRAPVPPSEISEVHSSDQESSEASPTPTASPVSIVEPLSILDFAAHLRLFRAPVPPSENSEGHSSPGQDSSDASPHSTASPGSTASPLSIVEPLSDLDFAAHLRLFQAPLPPPAVSQGHTPGPGSSVTTPASTIVPLSDLDFAAHLRLYQAAARASGDTPGPDSSVTSPASTIVPLSDLDFAAHLRLYQAAARASVSEQTCYYPPNNENQAVNFTHNSSVRHQQVDTVTTAVQHQYLYTSSESIASQASQPASHWLFAPPAAVEASSLEDNSTRKPPRRSPRIAASRRIER